MQKLVIAFAILILFSGSVLAQEQTYQAQTYTFPVHEAPIPIPKPLSIELEVLTPGCEKLLQYDPAHTGGCFETQLREVLAYHWNNYAIVDTKPETVSVTFAMNSKSEFSEFKLDKSSGNKKIDDAALALGAPIPTRDKYNWLMSCLVLPPGSPPVVVFRATLHSTPVKTGKWNENMTLLQTIDAEAIDFGPYMRDLQRRIKMAWFPPKGTESKKVVVIFKVHRNGALSNLRLDHASDVASADQAALKAVENAAPFRPLPLGAADDVDIQFTFDYNLFSGGGNSKGSFKHMLSSTCKTALLIPYYGSGLALLVPSNGGAYSSGDSGTSGGPGFFIPMGVSNNYGGFSGTVPGLFIQ